MQACHWQSNSSLPLWRDEKSFSQAHTQKADEKSNENEKLHRHLLDLTDTAPELD